MRTTSDIIFSKNWRCPVCKSDKYMVVRDSNDICGPGFRSWILHYICGNCAVHFSELKNIIR